MDSYSTLKKAVCISVATVIGIVGLKNTVSMDRAKKNSLRSGMDSLLDKIEANSDSVQIKFSPKEIEALRNESKVSPETASNSFVELLNNDKKVSSLAR